MPFRQTIGIKRPCAHYLVKRIEWLSITFHADFRAMSEHTVTEPFRFLVSPTAPRYTWTMFLTPTHFVIL